jgi:hypothetical protein
MELNGSFEKSAVRDSEISAAELMKRRPTADRKVRKRPEPFEDTAEVASLRGEDGIGGVLRRDL